METTKPAGTNATQQSTAYKPALIVMTGPQLIGKTVLSKSIHDTLGIQTIDVDDMKFALYGDSATKIGDPEKEKVMIDNAYVEMYRRAKEILDSGEPVITIATHSRVMTHELAKATAKAAKVPLIVVRFEYEKVTNLDSFLKERLKNRLERRDGGRTNVMDEKGLDLAKSTWGRFIPISSEGAESIIIIRVDPNAPQIQATDEVISKLGALLRRESVMT